MKFISTFSFFFLISVGACINANLSDTDTVYIADWVLGKWQYQNDKEKTAIVTLYPDGSALGDDGSIGSWYFFDRDLSIVWISGWVDVIVKDGESYIKKGYAPGIPTSSAASNESKATKVGK